jgi:hypothetical protein
MIFADYQAPYLFPNYEKFATAQRRRSYLEEELVRLANAGALSVTDLYNQRDNLRDECGEIILGQDFDDEGNSTPGSAPPELEMYRVKIRALDSAWNICFISGSKLSNRLVQGGSADTYASCENDKKARHVEDTFYNAKAAECELPLALAWRCLRQYGAFCAPCLHAERRPDKWKCEEVKPANSPSTSPTIAPVGDPRDMMARIAALESELERVKSTSPSTPPAPRKIRPSDIEGKQ